MELIALFIFIFLLVLGYVAGTITEKNHYKSIHEREKTTRFLPLVTLKKPELVLDPKRTVESAQLVTGSVVVSVDYFKLVSAALRNLVGGNVRAYETMVDRGRREALLRMKKEAAAPDLIMNVRVETSTIGGRSDQQAVGAVEVIAYGTAIRYKR